MRLQITRTTFLMLLPLVVGGVVATAYSQTIPSDETGAIDYLSAKGIEIQRGTDGHAVRLMSSGKPAMTADEYQLIGRLTHLEQLGINGAPLGGDQWAFLKSLPKLKTLSIWHCRGFATLEPFSDLPVESLTIGGCMGLRDLNKDNADGLRHAIMTLHDLPELRRVSLYHSPLAPDDAHLNHVVKSLPKLEDLRLDFAAPRGSRTTITPEGLAQLQALPLKVLNIENAGRFSAEHLEAIAGIRTLQALLVDARKTAAPIEAISTFKKLRPDVAVVIAGPDAKGPPRIDLKRR